MKQVPRKFVAWLCLSALLFSQLAVAAYACPKQMDQANAPIIVAAPVDSGQSEMAAMPMDPDTSAMAAVVPAAQPCPMTDQERPKLCEQHCLQASQSVDTQPQSALSAPILPLIATVVQTDVHLPTPPSVYDAWLVKAFEPPPLVRFGVLRI